MSTAMIHTRGTFFIGIIMVLAAYPAIADDSADCNNGSLPARQALEACLHVIKKANGGTPNDVAPGKTSIIGYFDGCSQGKRFKLLNGRTMECHTTLTHTGTALNVQIISDVRVIIDGEEAAVIIY